MSELSFGLVEGSGAAAGPVRRGARGPRVLVVEDTQEAAQILVEGLCDDEQAFDAFAVSSLSGALACLSKERVECVLLDYFLPDANGLESLRALQRAATGVPVVVMTAAGSEGLVVEVMKAGAVDYVVKHGIYLSRAINAVRQAIARRAIESATARLAQQKVFVGRTTELETLEAAVDDALYGRGRMFLLEGAAGIGKTALARKVEECAKARGFQALRGRCHETGGVPAYWPWIQILRASIAGADAGTGLLLRDATEAAPQDAQRLAALLSVQTAEHEQERFRCFDEIVLCLKSHAKRQPTLIIVDDLQWADRSSLLLLQFLARELSDSPLLVLCGYRDAEPGMEAATARVLAEIRREATNFRLRGLSEEEVRAQVRLIADQRAPAACACAPVIFRRTDGNPLYVEELLRHLLDEGIVYHDGEGWRSRVAPEDIRLPDTLRELAERGLRHVSAECRKLLSIGSVIGREFRLDAVSHVADLPVGEASDVLDEAVKRRIVEALPGAVCEYRFCQSPVREALYEELATLRRAEIHERAGEYLERARSAEIDLYAEELAYHFLRSANPQSTCQAADYAVRAARRAERLMAHEEAARNYEVALQALGASALDDTRRRGELLLKTAECWSRAADSGRARRTASAAAETFRALGSQADFARAALVYAGDTPGLGKFTCDPSVVRILEEALAALGGGDSGLHARLTGRLAEEIAFSGDCERRRALGKEAIEMARTLGEPAVRASVLKSMHSALWLPENFERRPVLADEFVGAATAAGDGAMRFEAHLLRAFARLERADMRAAQKDFAICSRLADELRQPHGAWTAAVARACRALALGRLGDVERLAERAFELGKRAQSPQAALFRTVQLAHLCWLQGRFTELGLLRQNVHEEQPLLLPALEGAFVLTRCEQGPIEEARASFERLAADRFGGLPRDPTRVQNLIFLAQACWLLGDAVRAAELYELLRPFDGRVLVFPPVLLWGAASHFLGLLAATMGRHDLARRHFEDALATNASIGAKQWHARTQLAYAEFLLAAGADSEREHAAALLQQSLQTSEMLGMEAVVERARAVTARSAAAVNSGSKTRELNSEGVRHHATVIRDAAVNTLRCEGAYWVFAFGGRSFTVPHTKGLKLVEILLRNPRKVFHVSELWAVVEPVDPDLIGTEPRSLGEVETMRTEGNLGPVLDPTAKRQYKTKIASLREQIEQADQFNETEKARRLRVELQWLFEQLKQAVGIGGRDRLMNDPVERLRQKVQKNIKAAREAIAKADPPLARHLELYVNTGRCCSYTPDPEHPIQWDT